MRKALQLVFLTALLTSHAALARSPSSSSDSGPFGLGVSVGIPAILSGKLWIGSTRAVDMGFALRSNDHMLFLADYLLHYPGTFQTENRFFKRLTPYFGVGGLIAFTTGSRNDHDNYLGKANGSVGFAVRVPFGAEWRPTRPPLGVFLELAPGVSVVPETSTLFQLGLGIRYYF